MKDILGYLLIGLAAVGVLVGVTGDVIDALRCEPAPIEVRLQQVLDRGVAKRRSNYPGMVLRVDSEASGTWLGAAGLADTATGEPMATDSRFGIGSIAKPFVAVVVLQLMEEGLLDLDMPIDSYLPQDLPVAVPNAGEITVRMLLNHTSGIPEWLTQEVIERIIDDLSIVWSEKELLSIAFAQDMLFEPGEGYAYSNTDYTLLGIIIEELTGLSWIEQVQSRILEPLALTETVIRAPGDAAPVPRMAHGYATLGRETMDTTAADPSMAGAAGGNAMTSSVSDLARFITVLLDGGLFVSPETLDEMLDYIDAPDEHRFPYWYGLGIQRYDLNGITFIGHAGGAVGYSSVMYVAPDAGITIVGSLNDNDLARVYLDLMLPVLKELARE